MQTDNDAIVLDGVRIPRFLYGTAWKENETQRLTEMALRTGFRGIDTANQRKHYHEAAVGVGISSAIDEERLTRDELFLQTKFTFSSGQDHRLPYDPAADIATQVSQSFASSLGHLNVSRIDAYLLHGPSVRSGLGPADRQAWQAMEQLHDSGTVGLLGISNVSLKQLELLCSIARIPPRIVQNRCYAIHGWDRDVREFCRTNGIVYEGFSLLTANRAVLTHPDILAIAGRRDWSAAQTIFRFAIDIGMVPLTGTTSAEHMRADLQVFNASLTDEEVQTIELIASR